MSKYPWHPADIKAAIEKRGGNLAQIGRDAGISIYTPKQALRQPCYTGEQAIADFLGVPAHTIWPDRYDADGVPLHPRVRKFQFNAPEDAKKRKKARVA